MVIQHTAKYIKSSICDLYLSACIITSGHIINISCYVKDVRYKLYIHPFLLAKLERSPEVYKYIVEPTEPVKQCNAVYKMIWQSNTCRVCKDYITQTTVCSANMQNAENALTTWYDNFL